MALQFLLCDDCGAGVVIPDIDYTGKKNLHQVPFSLGLPPYVSLTADDQQKNEREAADGPPIHMH